VVGGFSEVFRLQHPPPPHQQGQQRSRPCRSANDIRVDDLIVAVGNLDALSPEVCSFDKVSRAGTSEWALSVISLTCVRAWQVVRHLTVYNSSRDPKRGLGGVGHAASSG
jgi:hypothetical protein